MQSFLKTLFACFIAIITANIVTITVIFVSIGFVGSLFMAFSLAVDFAKVEEMKKIMETKLQKSININDTRKTKDGINFTMLYEKGK